MSNDTTGRRMTRRALLLGGAGAATAYAMHSRAVPRPATDLGTTRLTANVAADVHLAATDGWASMPPTAPAISPYWPDPLGGSHGTDLNLYVFGFRNVTGLSDAQVASAPRSGPDQRTAAGVRRGQRTTGSR